jgi:hypothetical protein
MCIVSFYKKVLNIAIHNQYPSLELVSPVYCSIGTVYCVPPNQQVDTGTMTEASFRRRPNSYFFKGALLYKLQRKHANRTDNQPNTSTTSIKDTATSIYLLVSWHYKYSHKLYVCLIECTNDFTWDEDKLWVLHRKYFFEFHWQRKPIIMTWLIYGDAVMKTKLDITYEPDFKLDIIISEGAEKYNTKDPISIDTERSVLSLSMLTVLIYALSFWHFSSFKLNIHNQCSNADLISPKYITSYKLECHRPPDYKVYAGDTMRSGFIIESDNESHGILIYKLQRKKSHEYTEISEDTSDTAHILVVWKFSKSKKLYADVLLVECDRGFVWNESNLKELYVMNFDQDRLFSDTTTKTWLLDDNITLMTAFEIMNEDRILNITISEVERNNNTMMPLYIEQEK